METRIALKIGLDFHGVIADKPDYFKSFCDEAERRGHEIYIISGGPNEAIARFLKNHKIKYNHLFAILDFYNAKGKVIFYEDGGFRMDDELWDSAKAKYCAENHIDIHIDDSKIYEKYFTTPYCRYNQNLQKCMVRTTIIDFSQTPEIVLDAIEKFIENNSPQYC